MSTLLMAHSSGQLHTHTDLSALLLFACTLLSGALGFWCVKSWYSRLAETDGEQGATAPRSTATQGGFRPAMQEGAAQ